MSYFNQTTINSSVQSEINKEYPSKQVPRVEIRITVILRVTIPHGKTSGPGDRPLSWSSQNLQGFQTKNLQQVKVAFGISPRDTPFPALMQCLIRVKFTCYCRACVALAF